MKHLDSWVRRSWRRAAIGLGFLVFASCGLVLVSGAGPVDAS